MSEGTGCGDAGCHNQPRRHTCSPASSASNSKSSSGRAGSGSRDRHVRRRWPVSRSKSSFSRASKSAGASHEASGPLAAAAPPPSTATCSHERWRDEHVRHQGCSPCWPTMPQPVSPPACTQLRSLPSCCQVITWPGVAGGVERSRAAKAASPPAMRTAARPHVHSGSMPRNTSSAAVREGQRDL